MIKVYTVKDINNKVFGIFTDILQAQAVLVAEEKALHYAPLSIFITVKKIQIF